MNSHFRTNCSLRSSIGAVGVRLCSSAQLAMLLEVKSLKLQDFAQGSGQPQTAAWLCFYAEIGLSSPHCRQCPCWQQLCHHTTLSVYGLSAYSLKSLIFVKINGRVSLFKSIVSCHISEPLSQGSVKI